MIRQIQLFLILVSSIATAPLAQAITIDSGSYTGSLAVGQTVTYNFVANAGNSVSIQMAETVADSRFDPRMYLYNPDGSLRSSDWGNTTAQLNNLALTQSGEYSLIVQEYNANTAGSYILHFAKTPQANEGGALAANDIKIDNITVGDIDSYTFQANAGDTVSLQVAETEANSAFDPYAYIYNPDGSLRSSDWGNVTAQLNNIALTQSGTYTVLVREYNGNVSAPYALYFAKSPGANEGGSWANHKTHNDTLAVGEIDSYTFTANAGDTVSLQVAETQANSAFDPYAYIYNPDGSLRSSDWGNVAAQLTNVTLNQTGTYTVLIREYNGNVASPYVAHFAKAPGANEGGRMSTTDSFNDNLSIGDIDTFTFTAHSGDTVSLQMSETLASSAFDPYAYIYNPDGSLRSSDWDNTTAQLNNISLAQTGTYTVLLREYNGNVAGPYSLNFSCFGECGNSAPDAPTQIAPHEQTNDNEPTYQWYAESNATWYQLEVTNANGLLHRKWYSAADASCSSFSGTCQVTPSVAFSGSARWRVRGWNSEGNGSWSNWMSFTVTDGGPPPPATLISPSGSGSATPTFRWNAVTQSTWYYIWIDDNTGNVLRKWYTAANAGCGNGTGICEVTPNIVVSGTAKWWIQTWNSAGTGRWSSSLSFSLNSIPGKPTLISPIGTSAGQYPTFVWNEVSNATRYYLWVNEGSSNIFKNWYERSSSELNCNGHTCTIMPGVAVSGQSTWWIKAASGSAEGPWSPGFSFTP